MTIYTWSINSMYTVQQPDPDYVVRAFWTLTGTDGNKNASVSAAANFSQADEQQNFIPYDQLTQEVVIGWVQAQLGEVGIASYQSQIDAQLNPRPEPEFTPLPWAQQGETNV